MTLAWIFRMVLVWLWMLIHGADPATCERVWDMNPYSRQPPNKTYEQWYGSPFLICDSNDHRHTVGFCLGPNC